MKLKYLDELNHYIKRHLEVMDYLMDDISRVEPEAISTIAHIISLSCAELAGYQEKLEIHVIDRYKKKAAKRQKRNDAGLRPD